MSLKSTFGQNTIIKKYLKSIKERHNLENEHFSLLTINR